MWKDLETYIKNHREDLDRDLPRPQVWERIEAELALSPDRKQGFVSLENFWRIAAAIVLILGGAWLWFQAMEGQPRGIASLMPKVEQLQHSSPAWEEAEAAYLTEVEQILHQIDAFDWEKSEAYQTLSPELQSVETQLQQLRKAHASVTNQDSLLQELVQLQEQHLELLQQLLASQQAED